MASEKNDKILCVGCVCVDLGFKKIFKALRFRNTYKKRRHIPSRVKHQINEQSRLSVCACTRTLTHQIGVQSERKAVGHKFEGL